VAVSFDSISHEWMLKFVQHRVADRRILRLIQKWLKAGVMEEGEWSETEKGTPQGAVVSPLLANIYLHYVFDLWVQAWRKKHARGDVVVVRYADDTVLGFQAQTEADRFLEDFRGRLGKFGLELHPDKTRRIEFGRYAELHRKRRGEGKPETFDFLGFTHIAATRPNSATLPERALRRQAFTRSEVGTVCASSASTGLCGGQRVTAVPTATDIGDVPMLRTAEEGNLRLPPRYSLNNHAACLRIA
jgi:RNA-directed DNA polymerase